MTASAPAIPSGLPLRQDDPVSFGLGLKVMLITALLLAIVYVVLRWAAQRNRLPGLLGQPELQCTRALRLSAKTRVYLLKSGNTEMVVTESANGATLTVLPSTPIDTPPAQP